MIEHKFKEGSYVHWVADRMFKAWNTYGRVTKVDGENVTILTYDDNKETTIKGEETFAEIKIVDESEVELHLNNQNLHWQMKINEYASKIKKNNKLLENISK